MKIYKPTESVFFMFDFLKKKIGSWFSKDKEENKDSSKSEEKKSKIKKIKEKKVKKNTIEKKLQILEKELKEDKLIKEEIREKQKDIEKTKETDKVEEVQDEIKIDSLKEEEPKEIEKAEEIEEEIKIDSLKEEEPKEGNFFTKLFKKITTSELSSNDFNEIFQEFEITLLENNVALEAVDKIRDSLTKNLVGQKIKKSDAAQKILQALKESILSLLIEPPNLIEQIKSHEGIFTIIFFGINGTGKTTTIAKLASMLKKEDISCVLAAADTFRAASIEQLKTHAEKLDIPVIASAYNADPASVAFEAKKYASAHKTKVVLIDTAGRMYTKENLLKEMEKIIRISKPNLKVFVGESITGNDAIEQAKTFNEAIGIDGIILSKADVDEKAGTILSVSQITGKPIYFLGTGQKYEDLEVFTKKIVLKNLGLE